MKFLIKEEELENIIEKYLDFKFDGAYLGMNKIDGRDWVGYWKTDDNGTQKILIGYPREHIGTWYSNGQILNGWDFFNITPETFYDYLRNYIEKKFGKRIQYIM